MKRVIGRMFTIRNRFHWTSRNFILDFFTTRDPAIVKTISIIQKVLSGFLGTSKNTFS
jgi:hypothetical protein